METDTVLYMQEDYFLTAPVDGGAVERYAEQMRAHPEIPCIQLTPEGIPAREPSRYEGLFTSDPDYPWYACCQGSLWRREALLSLLRKEESAWKFECFGSRRAKYSRMEFLTGGPLPVFPGGVPDHSLHFHGHHPRQMVRAGGGAV